ncbi:MAG: YraN family protein [Candidatus Omnitrophota bacterium]
MAKDNLTKGKRGEEEAVNFLRKQGYKIIARNFRTRLGEIDIIAKDKDTICFIEVKARSSDKFGLPAESVTGFKQRQISKAAIVFLKDKNLLDSPARFDIVSIRYPGSKIGLIKNAFELDSNFTL